MSQSQTVGLFGHRNHSLFSDYYLDNRAAQRPEWSDPANRAASAALLADLRGLWQETGPALAAANEAQTEARWAWTPLYRFTMTPDRARYFTHALDHLGDFAAGGRFPGGKTRTVRQKLAASKLPLYDPGVDLTDLDELQTEIADLSARIAWTDDLIDQIVYKLYGLSDEEVAVVAS